MTADLHFGHDKLAVHRGFKNAEEQDRYIIDTWNAHINKRDTVWILGDVAMGNPDNIDRLSELNGTLKLVLGNHDNRNMERYMRHVSQIYGAFSMRECILTHIPVHPTQLDSRYRYNIHGHLHTESVWDPRYFCVSAEQNAYVPIPLQYILEYLDRTNDTRVHTPKERHIELGKWDTPKVNNVFYEMYKNYILQHPENI